MILFDPIWTGLLANLKRLGAGGRGKMVFSLNWAILSQMTVKLSRNILRVEIFTN